MNKTIRGLAVFMAVLLVSCTIAPERKYIRLTMPAGEKLTMAAYDRKLPDWAMADSALRMDFLVLGDATDQQLEAVAKVEEACRIFTDTAHPSRLVAVASHGILYLGAGALGAGIGAEGFLNPRAIVDSNYYGYGAAAGAFNGVANGIVSGGGRSYTFQNCGREIMNLFPGYQVRILHKSPF